jgi:hypothetical protein
MELGQDCTPSLVNQAFRQSKHMLLLTTRYDTSKHIANDRRFRVSDGWQSTVLLSLGVEEIYLGGGGGGLGVPVVS